MINKNWDIVLKDEYNKEYFKNLGCFVKSEYKNKIVYPEYNDIFNALNTRLEKISGKEEF